MASDLSKMRMKHHVTVRKWEGGLKPDVDPPLEVVELEQLNPDDPPEKWRVTVKRGDQIATNAGG